MTAKIGRNTIDSANIFFVSLQLDDSATATAKKDSATATATNVNRQHTATADSYSSETAPQQKAKKTEASQGI